MKATRSERGNPPPPFTSPPLKILLPSCFLSLPVFPLSLTLLLYPLLLFLSSFFDLTYSSLLSFYCPLLHLYIRRPSTSFFFILILLTCSSLSLPTHSSRLSRPVLIQTSPTTYSFNTNDNKLISHPYYSFPPSHTSVSRAFLTLL